MIFAKLWLLVLSFAKQHSIFSFDLYDCEIFAFRTKNCTSHINLAHIFRDG